MQKEPPTIQDVVAATSRITKVPMTVLLNPKLRAREVSRARHIAQYVARSVTYMGWPKITQHFKMVHPSAYNGAKIIERELAGGNSDVRKTVDAVTKAVAVK